jgi:hypothetical protein
MRSKWLLLMIFVIASNVFGAQAIEEVGTGKTFATITEAIAHIVTTHAVDVTPEQHAIIQIDAGTYHEWLNAKWSTDYAWEAANVVPAGTSYNLPRYFDLVGVGGQAVIAWNRLELRSDATTWLTSSQTVSLINEGVVKAAGDNIFTNITIQDWHDGAHGNDNMNGISQETTNNRAYTFTNGTVAVHHVGIYAPNGTVTATNCTLSSQYGDCIFGYSVTANTVTASSTLRTWSTENPAGIMATHDADIDHFTYTCTGTGQQAYPWSVIGLWFTGAGAYTVDDSSITLTISTDIQTGHEQELSYGYVCGVSVGTPWHTAEAGQPTVAIRATTITVNGTELNAGLALRVAALNANADPTMTLRTVQALIVGVGQPA